MTRKIRKDLWVGLKPYGAGEVKPNHYAEMARTIWENRDSLPHAWRILSKGVCDGCALGVAGFHDWTITGVHLCTTRLNLLRLNTMGAMPEQTMQDVQELERLSGKALRSLGRLAYPMVRRTGDKGFKRISWDEALDRIARRITDAGPDRIGFYLTARGLTNEVYYAAQKAARFIGTNNIDNAARVCHAPSTAALKKALGVGATTVSYSDVLASDLIVLFGSNVANDQPVFMKYLYLARKDNDTKVAVVNPYREPGLERYWVPSNVESALFGTKMTDEFFQVHTGGDVAFISGVMKVLLERKQINESFVQDHTQGFAQLKAALDKQAFADLERLSGATLDDMVRFAKMYATAKSAILIWSMGITQHSHGTDNVRAIVNLALARGNVGRSGAGVMPIRGHSGVQGGAEMGAYATVLPGGAPYSAQAAAELSDRYGFKVRAEPGMTVGQMLIAAANGNLDVLYSSGGNFLEVLPDPARVRRALEKVPLRVHQDIVVSSQMLADGEEVILLPAATRYEQAGGGTETTTERRIIFSPQIKGPKVGEARSEWEIFTDLAGRCHPEKAELIEFKSGQAIREEIARIIPLYEGIQDLKKSGDQVQWGGPRLCEGWEFPTQDGKAHFSVVFPPELDLPEGKFLLSTRRGKQFNTMVTKSIDPLTGAGRRDVFLSARDAQELRVAGGDPVVVKSPFGEMQAIVHIAAIKPGNAQVFFPEGNVLIDPSSKDEACDIPDYNAVVEIVPSS